MTPQELYDHITERTTPEKALLYMLECYLKDYKHTKLKMPPLLLIMLAAQDIGWVVAKRGNTVIPIDGLIIGTNKFVYELTEELPGFPKVNKN